MKLNEPLVWFYACLYVLALAVAVWRRKAFPLADALTVLLIAGFGFTGLVYFVAPPLVISPVPPLVQPAELVFTVAYLAVTAALLVRGAPVPKVWKDQFFKKGLVTILFKLLVFVLIPLSAVRVLWATPWGSLGFTAGDVFGQLRSAALLILILGGFNLLIGGGAAPIRARQFSTGQVTLGLGLAFLWNTIEVGLVEEFFFRGFLQTRLIGFLGIPTSGIVAASLLFGLAHVPGIYLRRGEKHGPLGEQPTLLNSILYAILALSPTGWFMGLLFWRTQSLFAPILVHAAVDAVAHTAEFLEGLGFQKRIGTQVSAQP